MSETKDETEPTFEIFEKLIKVGLDNNWHLKEAKYKAHVSLLSHSISIAGVTEELMNIIGGFSEYDRKIALGLAFCHDFVKEDEERADKGQKVLTKERKERLAKILKSADFSDEDIEIIAGMYTYSSGLESPSQAFQLFKQPSPKKDSTKIRKLVHDIGDYLASIVDFTKPGNISESLINNLKEFDLNLTYHSISPIRGVLSSAVHEALHKKYQEKGWTPILYRANGTLYVGKGNPPTFTMEEIIEGIANSLKEYLNNALETVDVGSKAVGTLNATIIASPKFLFLNEKTIEQFWNKVFRQVKSPKNIDKENDKAYLKKWKIEEKEAIERMKLLIKLEDILKFTKGVIEVFEEKDKKDIIREFAKALNVEIAALEKGLDKIAVNNNSSPIREEKHDFAEKVIMGLGGWPTNENIFFEKIRDILCKCTIKEYKQRPPSSGLDYQKYAESLANDINYPLISDAKPKIEETYNHYSKGKIRGTAACNLCGQKPEKSVTAQFLGASQIFTNFLAGGSNIGGDNKLCVCSLCELEMELRGLMYSGDVKNLTEYYLIPQFSQPPVMYRRWRDIASHLIEGMDKNGVYALRDFYSWARKLNEDFSSLNDDAKKIISQILNPSKGVIDKVEQVLKDDIFGGDIEEAKKTLSLSECKNWKDLSNTVIKKISTSKEMKENESSEDGIPDDIRDIIKNILHQNAGTYIGITPNYILVNSLDYIDDREAVKALIYLFRGALASRLFLCSTIIKDINFEPLFEYTPKGAVLTSMPLDLDRILNSINIPLVDSWLPLEKVDVFLKKFSCVVLLGDYAWRENKGKYIYILTNLPGLTLNHIALNNNGNLKNAIDWLDIIFEEGKYATDVVHGR